MDIYISRSGSQEGPFKIGAVNSMIADKSLKTYDYAWYEGLTDWIMVKDVPAVKLPQLNPPAAVKSIPSKQTISTNSKDIKPNENSSSKSKVVYLREKKAFSGPLTDVIKLALRALIDCKFTVDNVNDSVGIISFQTGMQWTASAGCSCSITFVEIEDGVFKAQGSGKPNQAGFSPFKWDVGTGTAQANQAIGQMIILSTR